jgi:hypothetical protein
MTIYGKWIKHFLHTNILSCTIANSLNLSGNYMSTSVVEHYYCFVANTSTNITILWDVAPCSLAEIWRTFQRCLLSPSSGQWVNFYQTTQCIIPEDSHVHTLCHENLKSHLLPASFAYIWWLYQHFRRPWTGIVHFLLHVSLIDLSDNQYFVTLSIIQSAILNIFSTVWSGFHTVKFSLMLLKFYTCWSCILVVFWYYCNWVKTFKVKWQKMCHCAHNYYLNAHFLNLTDWLCFALGPGVRWGWGLLPSGAQI